MRPGGHARHRAEAAVDYELGVSLDAMLVREGRKELARECFRVIPVMAELDLRGYDLLFEH